MAETVFEELKRYVGFGDGDAQALRGLHPFAKPRFDAIADVFYQQVFEHEGARAVLQGKSVDTLRGTMVRWLDQLLVGPWDDNYYQLRCRIGRIHVRIGLPQHYMSGAMNVLRRELGRAVDETLLDHPESLRVTQGALGKILDIELAIMLQTYREDLVDKQGRNERLSMFGQLVGSIGHELRNPLSVIATSLFLLRGRTHGDERAQKHIDRIDEHLRVANQIITSLLDMIRDRPLKREPTELGRVLEAAAADVPRPNGARLEASGLGSLPTVQGDPIQLRQVFVNLFENAVQAAGPHGEVRIRAATVEGAIEVAVEDTGDGVPEEARLRLFEPLVTTKAKGLGLGLALVKRIVERHGGTIHHEDAAPRGARFIVRLPLG